ncbi:MAG: TRAM domain-containing protein [Candidatus Bathyarchaeia archaeon]
MSFVRSSVEVGKEYDVQITENGRWGDGIARVSGFVVFVSNAKPGQQLRVRITHVGMGGATAEVVA